MKFAQIVAAATCWCALSTVSARAETCDQRFPGSCRLEVSTTIVKVKGDTIAAAPRSSRRIKRHRKPLAKRVRAAVRVAFVPLPPAPPHRVAAFASTKPTTVVDDAFNSLAAGGSTDGALEAALINRRDQMLGFAMR